MKRIRNIRLRGVFLVCFFASFFAFFIINDLRLRKNSLVDLNDGVVEIYPQGSFFSNDVEVSFELYDDFRKCQLYYTIDGTMPTKESSRYTNPFILECEEDTKAIPICVRAEWNGRMSKVFTHTFFVGEDVYERFTTDVISIVADREDLYGDEGILVRGKMYDEWITAGGDDSIPEYLKPVNFMQRGPEWERDAHLEVISDEGIVLDSLNVGLSVSGGGSASYNLKSFDIKAGSEYDDTKWISNFIERNAEKNRFYLRGGYTNSICLRNSGNDFGATFVRQNICNDLAIQSGLYPAGEISPVSVFINGEYYSLLQSSNNLSRRNLEKIFSVDKEYVQKFKGTEETCAINGKYYDAITSDLTQVENSSRLESLVDIDNMIQYYAMELMLGNTDWIGNNVGIYWYQGEPMDGNSYSDGRIRFFLQDTDFCFYLTENNEIFDRVFGENIDDEPSYFKGVIKNDTYRNKFVNQVCDLLNSSFQTDNILEIANRHLEQIESEIYYMKKGNDSQYWATYQFEEHRKLLLNNITRRVKDIPEFLDKYFNVDDPYHIVVTPSSEGVVFCNTIEVAQDFGYYDGLYYKNYPVSVYAIPNEGYKFSHFEINGKKYYDSEIAIDESFTDDLINICAFYESTEGDKPNISYVCNEKTADYVELTNYYTNDLFLGDFYLSDRKEGLHKSPCPDIVLKSGETIRLFCKNSPVMGEYILNFNVKEMETVYLFDMKNSMIDYYFVECSD